MIQLLTLLAMGNWGNTPSPPLDSDAPDPVGNDGELHLEVGDERVTYLIHSARLTDEALQLEGEKINDQPLFTLSAKLPEGAFDGQNLARSISLEVSSATFRELESITNGSLTLVATTGSGSWEVDSELQLTGSSGDRYEGRLQARLRA